MRPMMFGCSKQRRFAGRRFAIAISALALFVVYRLDGLDHLRSRADRERRPVLLLRLSQWRDRRANATAEPNPSRRLIGFEVPRALLAADRIAGEREPPWNMR